MSGRPSRIFIIVSTIGDGFQLDFNNFDRSVCQILQGMGVCRTPYNVASMVRKLARCTIGTSACFAHFGQVYNHTLSMGMERNSLVRLVVSANHSDLLVVDFNFGGWREIGCRVLRGCAGATLSRRRSGLSPRPPESRSSTKSKRSPGMSSISYLLEGYERQ